MIGKPLLPDLHVRAQLFLGAIRKSTLNELDCFFQTRLRRKQNVNMVGHDNKLMQQIRRPAIVKNRINHQPRPRLSREKRTPFPRSRRDHVGVARVRGVFSGRPHNGSSAAKAADFLSHPTARLEGAPFQSFSDLRASNGQTRALHPFHSSIIFVNSLNR